MAGTNILLESGTNEVELIELYLDDITGGEPVRRSFGVNVAKVKKIIKQSDAKNFSGKKTDKKQSLAIDMSNPIVLGMFEFMDKVIPMVDLSRWLEMPIEQSASKMVVVTEFNNLLSSFLVSGVNRIHRVSWDEIVPLDENLTNFAGQTIIGTVQLDNPDRLMQVLDLERAIGELDPAYACESVFEFEDSGRKDFKVVTADDSMAMRNAVTRALESGGFAVSSFSNGRAAWDHLHELKTHSVNENIPITELVNMVVTDIEMPLMDGHNLTKRIKDDPVLRKLPVYLFSSLITEDLLHKGKSVGADRQYSKPQISQLVQDARDDCMNQRGC